MAKLRINEKTGSVRLEVSFTREEAEILLEEARAVKSSVPAGSRRWHVWDKVEEDTTHLLQKAKKLGF